MTIGLFFMLLLVALAWITSFMGLWNDSKLPDEHRTTIAEQARSNRTMYE